MAYGIAGESTRATKGMTGLGEATRDLRTVTNDSPRGTERSAEYR